MAAFGTKSHWFFDSIRSATCFRIPSLRLGERVLGK